MTTQEHGTLIVTPRLVSAVAELKAALTEQFNIDFAYTIMGQGNVIAANNALHGVITPSVPFSYDKASDIAEAIKVLRPNWNVYPEYEECVSISSIPGESDELYIMCGNANKTFGATIQFADADPVHHLDTGLDADTASVAELAEAMVNAVEGWLNDTGKMHLPFNGLNV